MRFTNAILLGCLLLLPAGIVNSVQTLKVSASISRIVGITTNRKQLEKQHPMQHQESCAQLTVVVDVVGGVGEVVTMTYMPASTTASLNTLYVKQASPPPLMQKSCTIGADGTGTLSLS
jgi:hypothetical protein